MLIINHKIWVPILSRLTRRIGQALSQPLPKGNKIAHHLANPYLQVNTAQLAGWLEAYIHERLFNEPFDPMRDESWRVLLLQPVIDHNTKVFAMALIDSEDRKIEGETEVRHRALSEVPKLSMSERSSLPVIKCI
ncbi:hypothetical protein [Propionivibrio sp.]|uniref:hypothetical protein n=1 Tax=Propionivibrio sp. TaxID=2212460 RepID=UPI003BF39B4A